MTLLGKTIIGIFAGVFGAMMLIFTGYETWTFLEEVTGSPIIAIVGLVMFEGGFIYWGVEFRYHAQGILQMAIALLASLFDFALVLTAVSLKLGAVDSGILGTNTGAVIVVVAVLVNLAAKYLFSLTGPEVSKNIMRRAAEGMAIVKTFNQFQGMVKNSAEELAETMANDWLGEMQSQFLEEHRSLNGKRGTVAELRDYWINKRLDSKTVQSNGHPVKN